MKKITRFLPIISFCFFNHFFAENFVDVGKGFSQNELKGIPGLMLKYYAVAEMETM